MKRIYVPALAVVLITGLLSMLWLIGLSADPIAAQQSKPDINSAGQWEYCVVSDLLGFYSDNKAIGQVNICYFQSSGCQNEFVKVTLGAGLDGNTSDQAKATALARAVAKLGSEGWEMTGLSTEFDWYHDVSERKAIFFKRWQK